MQTERVKSRGVLLKLASHIVQLAVIVRETEGINDNDAYMVAEEIINHVSAAHQVPSQDCWPVQTVCRAWQIVVQRQPACRCADMNSVADKLVKLDWVAVN